MPTKNLYYSEDDTALMKAAERVAKRKKISFSRLVTDALEAHVPKVAEEPAPAPPDRWAEVAADTPTAA